MTSIRRHLLIGLLGALTVAGLAAAAGVYLQARDEANILFDYQLKQIALALRDHATTALAVASTAQDNAEQEVVIQIWDAAGLHLYHSHPLRLLLPPTSSGLTTVATPYGAWRVFSLHGVRHDHVIQVAQPMHVRQAMAAGVALRTLLPWLAMMPLLGGMIWWLVGRGLQPLIDVAQAVSQRHPQALEPLPSTGLPREAQPLIAALNGLLQRLAAALATQRAFIADAAHALRTPLTAVHLQTQIVARTSGDEARQQAIAALQQGVQRVTHLVHQLLTLARLDPEAAQQPFTPVALNPLLHTVIADHASLAAEKAIDLGLARDDPACITGDVANLRILFGNLLENAIRYTPAGGTIDVQITSAPDVIHVEVADTGPGIPPEDRTRVFDRFYRREGSSVPGSGLGLAIVHTIATRHHAQITLGERDSGSGLVVRLTFPRA
jgi:two-component system, OmpR family, sensor kinase